jgi:hypothetical protein
MWIEAVLLHPTRLMIHKTVGKRKKKRIVTARERRNGEKKIEENKKKISSLREI